MNRRAFLIGLFVAGGGAGLAVAIGGRGCWTGTPLYVDLTEHLTDPSSARRIGRAYLEIEPADNDRDHLLDKVFPSLRIARTPPPRGEVERRLLEQIRADFESRRTVWVGEWLLSRTEARLYALTSLVPLMCRLTGFGADGRTAP